MTVRDELATMTSSTGREADDTLGIGESSPKRAKILPWVCGCDGGEVTVVASTDIPAHATARPYPGGLDFGARTSDHQATDKVVKVGWRDGRLLTTDKDDDHPVFACHHQTKLQLARAEGRRWMMALQPARDRHEQNVEVLAEGGRLVLHVLKPVRRGERLLLWYSDALARAFGVPILTPANIRGNQHYTCTACHTTFQYPNTLKAHILFRCDAAASSSSGSSSSQSPSLTAPSAFTATAGPASPFRFIGSGPSAFRVSSSGAARSPGAGGASRGSSSRGSSSVSLSKARRDWVHGALGPEVVCRSESGGKKSAPDTRRAMTPDSSTDESSALNLSTRKPLCPSGGPRSLSSLPGGARVCPDVEHTTRASSNPALGGGGGVFPGFPGAGHQPIQIFNHIHPPGLPALPLPLDHHVALRLYYPWLAALPDPSPAKIFCSASLPSAPAAMVDPAQQHLAFHAQNRSFNMFPHGFFSPPPDPQSLLMTSTAAKLQLPGRERVVMPMVSSRDCGNAAGGLVAHGTGSGSSVMPGSHPGSAGSKPCLPLIPVPSEKEGEPLDLLPPSFFASKSRKGHLCIYCGKLYSRKYGLKIHLRTHTGYKPLKCKVCLRPFGDPSNLNKHVRLHAEGDTPYRCDYCGKVLVRRRDLERHIRSRHPSEAKEDDEVSTECVDSEVDVTSDSESTVGAGDEQEIEVT